jgi:hypothetical protein
VLRRVGSARIGRSMLRQLLIAEGAWSRAAPPQPEPTPTPNTRRACAERLGAVGSVGATAFAAIWK